MDERSRRYQAAKKKYLEERAALEERIKSMSAMADDYETRMKTLRDEHDPLIARSAEELGKKTAVATSAMQELVEALETNAKNLEPADFERHQARVAKLREAYGRAAADLVSAQDALNARSAGFKAAAQELREYHEARVLERRTEIQQVAARAAKHKTTMQSIIDEASEE